MSSTNDLPVPVLELSSFGSPNLEFVESLYYEWLADPSRVEEPWRRYFATLPSAPGAAPPPASFPRPSGPAHRVYGTSTALTAGPDAAFQAKVSQLVQTYRDYGHLRADLDPLGLVGRAERFTLATFGLGDADLERRCSDPDGRGDLTLRELVGRLEETYCRTIGVELAHMHDQELRRWLEQRMERTRNRITLPADVKKRLFETVVEAEGFEQFVATKFLGAKRFSVEGAEGLLPLFELLVDRATGHGVRNLVIGMAHRGRLNVLANVIGKPAKDIFAEFRDQAIINSAGGDVKYHLGYSADRETPDGVSMHLSLSFNPSHLEWINTVVQGRVRAKQDRYRDLERIRTVPVLLHGDAAFAAQGIVAEALQMSELEAYSVGGTIHVIVNNQVGFTTSPRDARSTTYCTGPARMLQIPVLHVNGEDLEAIAQAVLLAVDFRQRFHRDVVIDLWAYRRHGHNEGDEPSFTQPVMYRAISRRPTLKALLAERLAKEGVLEAAEAEEMVARHRAKLEEAYHLSAKQAVQAGAQAMGGFWRDFRAGHVAEDDAVTAAAPERLREVGRTLTTVPQGFRIHPKLAKVIEARALMAKGEKPLDWAMGEALALGTLAWEGTRVRLVGQDVRRGTFSHRHAVLNDVESGIPYSPISHLHAGQGPVEIRDSLLSEAAALGYEYGYSLEMPDGLTVWEAQFGDFVNGAQVIIDQFLSSGEQKWNRLSGLVLLLPHGMEGQGPEHSSARLERFLELSVGENWRVVNLTTPAQYFHALRRQVRSAWRKPLVVMSPKSLLRHPQAVSPLGDCAEGAFRAVLPDDEANPRTVTRVVLCSGKLYYDLLAARTAQQAGHVALVRVEQLYPLDVAGVLDSIGRFRTGVELVWAQEEPSNMGAWDHVDRHLSPRLPARLELVGRAPSASPAAGSATRHKLEQEQLVREALGEPVSRLHTGRAAAQER